MKTNTMFAWMGLCACFVSSVSGYFHHAQQEQQQEQGHHQEDQQQQRHHHEELEHYYDYHGHPKYHFDYAVHDPHTHDMKKAWEHRDGKNVKGEYTVVQPDGKTRVVKYEGGKDGINYDVQYFHNVHHN